MWVLVTVWASEGQSTSLCPNHAIINQNLPAPLAYSLNTSMCGILNDHISGVNLWNDERTVPPISCTSWDACLDNTVLSQCGFCNTEEKEWEIVEMLKPWFYDFQLSDRMKYSSNPHIWLINDRSFVVWLQYQLSLSACMKWKDIFILSPSSASQFSFSNDTETTTPYTRGEMRICIDDDSNSVIALSQSSSGGEMWSDNLHDLISSSALWVSK